VKKNTPLGLAEIISAAIVYFMAEFQRRFPALGAGSEVKPLNRQRGGVLILPPSADFVEVRKLAKLIERRFFETVLRII